MSAIKRASRHAGIAIGAILFVVALLAVLMGALVAGSSGFGSNSASESHRTMGGALVQQGVSLVAGFQRLMTGGVETANIIITPQFSGPNALRALFAPNGGGLTPMQPPLDAVASGASWRFVSDANLPDFGAAGDNDVIALVQIRNDAICRAINSVVIGHNAPLTITLAVLPGVPVAADVTGTDGLMNGANSFDASAVSALSGIAQACVQDSNATAGFWYYQLIKAN